MELDSNLSGLEADEDLFCSGSSAEETASGRARITGSTSSVDETGILNGAIAKWPEYAKLEERLKTFRTWSKPKIDVNALVEAGMLYKGDEDRTECYYCGIPLKLWDIHDDPWIEHARFSQDCQFLHFHKGWAFVKAVLEFYDLPTVGIPIAHATYSMPRYRTLEGTNETSLGTSPNDSRSVCPRLKKRIEPRDIKDRLDMDNVKRLLTLGYPKELVGLVIAGQLQTEGDDFHSFGDLASSVISAAALVGVPLHTFGNSADLNSDQPGPHEVREIRGASNISRPGPYNRATRRKMKIKNNLKGQDLFCKLCKKKEVNIILKDCGHIVLCDDCAKVVHTCPKCHTYIKQRIMIYTSTSVDGHCSSDLH